MAHVLDIIKPEMILNNPCRQGGLLEQYILSYFIFFKHMIGTEGVRFV